MGDSRISLDELRSRLAGFQEAYDLCGYIDSWPAVLKCREDNRRVIDMLKAEIERRESEDDSRRLLKPVRLWGTGMGDGE
jgi:hypothetical protein